MAQALEINNLPTPQEETWKYTNLPRAIPANLNTADENHDIEITVAKGEVVTAPREIIFTGEDGQHHKPRLNISTIACKATVQTRCKPIWFISQWGAMQITIASR